MESDWLASGPPVKPTRLVLTMPWPFCRPCAADDAVFQSRGDRFLQGEVACRPVRIRDGRWFGHAGNHRLGDERLGFQVLSGGRQHGRIQVALDKVALPCAAGDQAKEEDRAKELGKAS